MSPVPCRRPTLVVSAALLFFSPFSRACGPDFPNCYLTESADELARLPTLSLETELRRLLPARPRNSDRARTEFPADTPEIAEIRAVLLETGLTADKASREIATCSRLRPPAVLPKEFQWYAEGAANWHAGEKEYALSRWHQLLELPANQRRHRTTWALFMIARANLDTNDQAACAGFEAVRQAGFDGFTDTEQLATASLGWEARIKFRRGENAGALRLYAQQFSEGDPGAEASIQQVLARIFGRDDDEQGAPASASELKSIAADSTLRGVVTAWFSARGGPQAPWSARAGVRFRRWIAALPAGKLDPAESDRWAWAAYQNGMWEEAARFAQGADADAPASEWVRGMLSLRNGDSVGAAGHLARAARAFPTDSGLSFAGGETFSDFQREDVPVAQLAGVRGVLALQREEYIGALRLFLEQDLWADAAYIAEEVLSVRELTEFVRRELPAAAANDESIHGVTTARNLRHLLARRLVRNGDFGQAREYFPADVISHFDDYVAARRQGDRRDLSPRGRAAALWEAARILRENGLEIQGTELEPDYAIDGGGFEWPGIRAVRLSDAGFTSARELDPDHVPARPPYRGSAGEGQRTSRIQLPSRRFHYRQHAAEIALLATTLLPDNDELTATILNTAGNWLAARYPDDADIYFKTLVFRCPETDLGRRAAARHWLVREPVE